MMKSTTLCVALGLATFVHAGTPAFSIEDGVLVSVELNGATDVTIPATVTSIGENAFRNLSSMRHVAIPNTVTSIGRWAFYGCSGLVAMEVPSSVESIGISAFAGCSGIKSVAIPKCICESVASGKLSNMFPASYADIQTVVIADGVTRIAPTKFSGCSSLVNVTIPSSVTGIGSEAFYGCTSLLAIALSANVTTIETSAFSGCSGLQQFSVANDNPAYKYESGFLLSKDGETLVAALPPHGLSEAVVPYGVKSILPYAFSGYAGVTSVTIPATTTSIGNGAFADCNDLVAFIVDGANAFYHSQGGLLLSKNRKNIVMAPGGMSSVEIPVGVTNICAQAFYRNTKLTEVSLPETLRSIGSSAFYCCTSLSRIEFPESIVSIGSGAFMRCTALRLVKLPERLTTVADSLFESCSALSLVEIPSHVASIQNYAFCDCSSLSDIVFNGNAPTVDRMTFYGISENCVAWVQRESTGWGVSIPGVWEVANTHTRMQLRYHVWTFGIGGGGIWISGCDYGGDMPELVEIPSTFNTVPVVAIGDETFSGREDLIEVTIPGTVKTIGSRAFANCPNLRKVVFEEGIETIGESAFEGCRVLKSVQTPSTIETIGQSAFQHCDQLTNAVVLAGDIGMMAFYGCGEEGGASMRLSLGGGVTSIGESAFEGCGVADLSIPSSVTNIGRCAFQMCTGITNLTINSGRTFNGDRFSYCFSIENVTIGDSCRRIDDDFGEFGGMLRSITIGKNVETIGDNVFMYSDTAEVTIPDSVADIGCNFMMSSHLLARATFGTGVTNIAFGCLADCENLSCVAFEGACAPTIDPVSAFLCSSRETNFCIYVAHGSTGWGVSIPGYWDGVNFAYDIDWLQGQMPYIAADFESVDDEAAAVANAIGTAGFADTEVVSVIGGSAQEYERFKSWARGVPGGEAAAIANTNAAVAYLLGAERLFENEPRIELGEPTITTSTAFGVSLTVSVMVKDGDDAVMCATEKVKNMFEATRELDDWNGAAKLTPIVTVHSDNPTAGNTPLMRFTVVPGDGMAEKAFLRVKVK